MNSGMPSLAGGRQAMDKLFLSIKDAAEYLGVDYKTIYRLVRSG